MPLPAASRPRSPGAARPFERPTNGGGASTDPAGAMRCGQVNARLRWREREQLQGLLPLPVHPVERPRGGRRGGGGRGGRRSRCRAPAPASPPSARRRAPAASNRDQSSSDIHLARPAAPCSSNAAAGGVGAASEPAPGPGCRRPSPTIPVHPGASPGHVPFPRGHAVAARHGWTRIGHAYARVKPSHRGVDRGHARQSVGPRGRDYREASRGDQGKGDGDAGIEGTGEAPAPSSPPSRRGHPRPAGVPGGPRGHFAGPNPARTARLAGSTEGGIVKPFLSGRRPRGLLASMTSPPALVASGSTWSHRRRCS